MDRERINSPRASGIIASRRPVAWILACVFAYVGIRGGWEMGSAPEAGSLVGAAGFGMVAFVLFLLVIADFGPEEERAVWTLALLSAAFAALGRAPGGLSFEIARAQRLALVAFHLISAALCVRLARRNRPGESRDGKGP